jgi:hypothetical protein
MGLTFDAATHTYTLDGTRVMSVTQVLKASGLINFDDIPESILEAARVRGTTVHQAIQFSNEGDLDLEQFRADFAHYDGYLDGWLEFRAQRRFTPILTETRVASRLHQVAGTIDCLGELDGEAVLLDYATGDPARACKSLQTAGYAGLALEWAQTTDADPRLTAFFEKHAFVRRYAVALTKDGTFGLTRYDDPSDFRQFLTLVEAQRIVRARRGARAEVVA